VKEFIAELEFFFPEPKRTIKGFADLVFRHRGKYYLVDWKSNYLEAYDDAHLKEAMEENGYYLQAEIYTEALRRYVKLFDNRPFEELFGGAFYIFIRGNRWIKI
jgi:exodeoxyribonuclease V beta subunit